MAAGVKAKPVELVDTGEDGDRDYKTRRIVDYQKRLHRALSIFIKWCPPSVRRDLSDFVPCVTEGWNKLTPPRLPNRFKEGSTRCESPDKLDLAEFHVADAVEALYAAFNHITHPILWARVITGLGSRVRAMEGIARAGYDACRVDGTTTTGYLLVDHQSSVKARDYAPIFGNSTIGNEPRDKEKGDTGGGDLGV